MREQLVIRHAYLTDQLNEATKLARDAEQVLADKQKTLRSAEDDLKEQLTAWQGHLVGIGLAATLSPEGAANVISRVEVCRERLEKVRSLRHRISAMERNRQEYLQVLNELLAARGHSPASHADAQVRLNQFLDAMRKEDETRNHREEARKLWMLASEERRRAEDTLLNATRAHQEALERQQHLNEERRELLESCSLPSHFLPGTVADFLHLIEQARDLLKRIQDLDRKLQTMTEQQQNLAECLTGLLASTGRASSGNTLTDMDALSNALDLAEKHGQQAAVLSARITEKERQIDDIRAELDEMHADVARLRVVIPQEDLEARRREITESQIGLMAKIDENQNRLGESRSRRQALATDERLARLHEKRESVAEQIKQAARKWAVLALAFRMFDSARKRFEESRQPAVVRRASAHLRRLTGDRYREVRMPLDGSALQVLPADGLPKTTEQLSRGTAEQLYLALRFGFIEEFTGVRDPLPIVIDDVLVNFDPGRARATIESLLQLSERFQILYFTCHPNIADQFREIDSSIAVFQLTNGQIESPTSTQGIVLPRLQ